VAAAARQSIIDEAAAEVFASALRGVDDVVASTASDKVVASAAVESVASRTRTGIVAPTVECIVAAAGVEGDGRLAGPGAGGIRAGPDLVHPRGSCSCRCSGGEKRGGLGKPRGRVLGGAGAVGGAAPRS